MKQLPAILSGLAALVVGGCASTDKVVFVTSTSIGINVDNTPPTTSIAYDRTEGFIGPRYPNGGIPAVVASIKTGGSVFDPKIRQVYATGGAAVAATGDDRPQAIPLEGSRDDARLVFFGTTTTLGLKASFSENPIPDSVVIGYKRKEFSVIPIATRTVDGKTTHIYPSVFGAIDSTIESHSLEKTGLSVQQFFATGTAAEALAGSEAGAVLKRVAVNAMTDTLSSEELQIALDEARTLRSETDTGIDAIVASVSSGGHVDAAKLARLIDGANARQPNSAPQAWKSLTTADALRAALRGRVAAVRRLRAQLP